MEVSEKNLTRSKRLMYFALILILLSAAIRIRHEVGTSRKDEAFIKQLTDVDCSEEMQEALNHVILKSGNTEITIHDKFMTIYGSGAVTKQIDKLIYDAQIGIITIYTDNIETMYVFTILPHTDKFKSQVEYRGVEFDIIYSDVDIENDNDRIFNILDVDNNGEVNVERLNRIRKQMAE